LMPWQGVKHCGFNLHCLDQHGTIRLHEESMPLSLFMIKKKQFTKSIFCRSWISLQTSCGILCIQKMNQNLQFLYYCLLRSTDPSKVLFQFAKSYVPNPLPLFCSVLLSRLSGL
jgi:hypothetical protein